MSSMGVPSSISSLLTSMLAPLTPSTSTTDIPTGLGLMGEQVLNTPVSLPCCPDVCQRYSEGEDHNYALTSSDVSKAFRVFLVDNERSLDVGNAPVPGELCGVRTDEADGPQLDVHTEPPCVHLGICLLPIRRTAYGKSLGTRWTAVEEALNLCTLLGPAAPP
jgi:hypothetical protein